MSDVLVINRNFYAIQITSWQKAISLVYSGQADVVDDEYRLYNFEDWKELSAMIEAAPSGFIHTTSFKLVIPDVIRLVKYDKLPVGDVKFTRKNLYSHYKNTCCYCGGHFKTSELNLDHVLPRSREGKTTWDNIVLSCIPCNTSKADRTPTEAKMKMHYQPSKPRWKSHIGIIASLNYRKKTSWQRFIDAAYWNTELQRD